jgi:hypothetical protein
LCRFVTARSRTVAKRIGKERDIDDHLFSVGGAEWAEARR